LGDVVLNKKWGSLVRGERPPTYPMERKSGAPAIGQVKARAPFTFLIKEPNYAKIYSSILVMVTERKGPATFLTGQAQTAAGRARVQMVKIEPNSILTRKTGLFKIAQFSILVMVTEMMLVEHAGTRTISAGRVETARRGESRRVSTSRNCDLRKRKRRCESLGITRSHEATVSARSKSSSPSTRRQGKRQASMLKLQTPEGAKNTVIFLAGAVFISRVLAKLAADLEGAR
jgi:hypothetical protein